MLKITKSVVLSFSLLAIGTSAYAEDKKVEQHATQSEPAKIAPMPAKAQTAPAATPVPVAAPVNIEPIKVEGARAAQLLREGVSEEVKSEAPKSDPDPLFIGIFTMLNTLVPFAVIVALVCGVIIIRGRNKAANVTTPAVTTEPAVAQDATQNAETQPATESQPESKS